MLACSLGFVFAQILLRQVVHPHGYQCWSVKPQPSLQPQMVATLRLQFGFREFGHIFTSWLPACWTYLGVL